MKAFGAPLPYLLHRGDFSYALSGQLRVTRTPAGYGVEHWQDALDRGVRRRETLDREIDFRRLQALHGQHINRIERTPHGRSR